MHIDPVLICLFSVRWDFRMGGQTCWLQLSWKATP